MALKDEIKEQTVKLKNMTVKEKIAYICTYYKWYFIIAAIVIISAISITKTIIRNNRPLYLHAEFVNSNLAYTEDTTIYDDFIKEYNIDTEVTPLFIGFSNVIYDEGDQMSYANQIKMIAQYSANELDVVCGPESLINGRLNVGEYTDLEKLLPDDLMKELKDKGYEFFIYKGYPEEDINGESLNPSSEPITPYIGGIYIDNCEYLNNINGVKVYTLENGDRPVLTVAPNTKNPEHAVEFIRMLIK